jgi:hypothetical protein
MLQEAMHELRDGKARGAEAIAFGFFIAKKDPVVFNAA